MTDVLTEASEVVANLQTPTTFSLADRLKGRGFPTESVKIYLNEDAGYQLVSLMSQEKPTDQAALVAFNDVVQQVTAEVLESELTIEFRGISTGHINQIKKTYKKAHQELDSESVEYENGLWYEFIAPHIIRIKDHAGGVDEHKYTAEEIADLHSFLPLSEWGKIMDTVSKLSFITGYFENATDAGFLPRS